MAGTPDSPYSGPRKVTEITELQWNQLIRLLDRQAEILSQLRDRTGIVLTATGIVSALFGVAALNNHPPNAAFWLGLIIAVTGLAAGLWFSILVLLPVKDTDTESTESRDGPMSRSAKVAGRLRQLLADADKQRKWGVTLPTSENIHLSTVIKENAAIAPEDAARASAYAVLTDRPAQNFATIDARTDFFIAACASLFVQLVGWIVALIAHG